MQDSIQNSGVQQEGWHTVNEIVVPSQSAEQLLPVGMSSSPVRKAVGTWKPVKSVADSIAKAKEDSIVRAVNDSIAKEKNAFGVVLQPPYREHVSDIVAARVSSGDGLSWVFAVLAILFCAVCLKIKNTPRYIKTLVSDMKDVSVRHNMFDNTVKETSFLIILIIAWICCVGILLWQLLKSTVPGLPAYSVSIPDSPLAGIGLCSAVAASYVVFMLIAYEITGNVFSDRKMTRIWVKGASATMGLQVFLFFPLALLSLCYPEWNRIILILAGSVFVIGKIQFIYRGFRIFFNQFSSWLLFLYYLCSLEIVPLILSYLAALQICVMWL